MDAADKSDAAVDPAGQAAADDHQAAIKDLKAGSGQLARLTPEDRRAVVNLHQAYPQLRHDFRNIVDFADLLDLDPQNYEDLFQSLAKITKSFRYRLADICHVSRFAAAVGFAEQAAKLLRRVVSETGQVSVASMSSPYEDSKAGCAHVLSSTLMNFTDKGEDFRLRLARTGILRDMALGLAAIQHLSGDVLDKGRICLQSIGTIHNCCKHPEVLPMVMQMKIVPHISPFLQKKCHGIRVAALLLLGFIAADCDLGLLALDHEMLQFCVCRAEAAWASHNRGKNGWETEELLVGLSKFARLPFNRRLIVAKGVLPLLTSVLQSGVDDEREAAADTLAELAQDTHNISVFQRDQTLTGVLEGMKESEPNQTVLHVVAELLALMTKQSVEDCDDNPVLCDLLADQLNVLAILGMGKVEFLLDQLTVLACGGSSSSSSSSNPHSDVTSRVKMLQALKELAADDSCRRELLARGALDLLQKLLHSDAESEKEEAAHLLMRLTSCKEYCILIQAHTGLMGTLKGLRYEDNQQLATTATHITDTVTGHTYTMTQ